MLKIARILLPCWKFLSFKLEDKFWQRPENISFGMSLSDSDQPACHPCWQIIPQSLGKFHAHSDNLSQQCVICRPDVISVSKEKPKLRKGEKGSGTGVWECGEESEAWKWNPHRQQLLQRDGSIWVLVPYITWTPKQLLTCCFCC